jgi:hypothetical protein
VPDFPDDWPDFSDVTTTLQSSGPTPSPEIIRLGPSPSDKDRLGVEENEATTAAGPSGPVRSLWVVLSILMGVTGFMYL